MLNKFFMVMIMTVSLLSCASQETVIPKGLNQQQQHRPAVVVYGVHSCLKTFEAKLFLSNHHIPYQFYHVLASEQGRVFYSRLGGPGVPVILVGKQQMIGFNKPLLIKWLKQAGYL